MQISKTITRRNVKDNPYSYHSLRREGIALLQDFSGKNWSDYNAHDPGVTMLEQLCYGLTDSIYRTEFDVADYLVNKNNQLDLESLSLIPAEKILPCRPCTLEDYHQAIMDAVDEVEHLWITLHTDDKHAVYNGLYAIEIQLTASAQARCNVRSNLKQMIIDKVVRTYTNLRNLSEDLAKVTIIEPNNYQLISDIEITRHIDVNDVLADIYFITNQWFKDELDSNVSVCSYEELLAAGQSFEQIFDGPTTRYSKNYQHVISNTKSIAALYSAIQAIPNVTRINQLNLLSLTDGSQLIECANDRSSLSIPQQDDDIKVTLRQGDHPVSFDFLNFNKKYQHKLFKTAIISNTHQEADSLYQRPTGEFREFNRYYSIQNDLPITYHLNVQGVSSSISLEELAKVKQLRGYLTIFEQFLANFNANITGIRTLFSKDISNKQSYHFNYIDNKTIKGVEALYVDNAYQKLPSLLAKFDLYEERKSRVLDYLLALYGEALPLPMLSQFDKGEPQSTAKKMMEQKAEYLSSIVEVTKDRGGAFDYTRQFSNNNKGGFYNRLAFHLGLKNQKNVSCCDTLESLSLQLISDEKDKSLFIKVGNHNIDRLISVDALPPKKIDDFSIFKKLVKCFSTFENNTINRSLFLHGMNRERYRLLLSEKSFTTKKQSFDVIFSGDYSCNQSNKEPCSKQSSWLYIGRGTTEARAHQLVNLFIQFITYINEASEQFHLVEHILLRPDNQILTDDVDDDLSCQISVIMPNYTQRFSNIQYQQQAEQEIHVQCPSHILPNVFWFDYPTMMAFESLYFEWISLRKSQVKCCTESKNAANALMTFLRDQSSKKALEPTLNKTDSVMAKDDPISEFTNE